MQSFDLHESPARFYRLFFSLPAVMLLLACGLAASTPQAPAPANPTGPAVPGDVMRSLVHAEVERTYLLHIPPGYDAAHPTPLVLAFHGIGLNAEEMARISGLNKEADHTGFIVVYPNGTGEKKSWNGGRCCGEAARNRVDDVGFVRALIDELASFLAVDPKRIYATGFSNGAILTYRLACELSDRIAAIGPVAATQVREDQATCRPERSVPVIHFHGTADRLNPYNGGTTSTGLEFVAVEEAIEYWAERDACPTPQQTGSGSIQHDVYAPCAQGSAVELYRILEGEHAWPGGEAVNPQIGEPTMEISATSLMWGFFAAHPMP